MFSEIVGALYVQQYSPQHLDTLTNRVSFNEQRAYFIARLRFFMQMKVDNLRSLGFDGDVSLVSVFLAIVRRTGNSIGLHYRKSLFVDVPGVKEIIRMQASSR